jgi:hypothetical protein
VDAPHGHARQGEGLVDRGGDLRVNVAVCVYLDAARDQVAAPVRDSEPGHHQPHPGFDGGDVRPERPDRVQRRRQRVDALERHPAPCRLEADHAAAGGRDPDGSTGVRPERDVRLPARHRDGRPA